MLLWAPSIPKPKLLCGMQHRRAMITKEGEQSAKEHGLCFQWP